MPENKFDLTSTVAEKGVDLIKDFLEKLILPSVQEVGLLMSEQVSKVRFNNQLKMLMKTREKCIKFKIDPKTISLKLLCPLLEGASLEESEEMSNVWASLLSNLVDSDQNIQNHVFPYLLGQISIQEWNALKESYFSLKNYTEKVKIRMDNHFKYERLCKKKDSEIQELKRELDLKRITNDVYKKELELINKEKEVLKQNLHNLSAEKNEESNIISSHISEEYQYSNLLRLGLISQKPTYHISLEEPKEGLLGEISKHYSDYRDEMYEFSKLNLNLNDVRVYMEETGKENSLTELGIIFIKSCLDKDKQ